MITAIEIENFKGIGERQRIEFAPLTLIFGANSSGKSTIVHALHYLREILKTGNGDIDEIRSTDGELRLGGFENLVHRHETNRKICIRIETKMQDDASLHSHMNGLKRWLGDEFDGKVLEQVKNLGLEIEIEKANFSRLGFPTIDRLQLILDGKQFAEINATDVMGNGGAGTVAHVCTIDLDHPTLTKINTTTALRFVAEKCHFSFENYDAETGENLRDIYETIGALPTSQSHGFGTYIRDDDTQPEFEILESFLREFLVGIVVESIQHINDNLDDFGHIGPIRDIPERHLRKSISKRQISWYRGKAAWQVLLEDTPKTLGKFEGRPPWSRFYVDLQEAIEAPYRIERVGLWKSTEEEWCAGSPKHANRSHLELVLRDLRTDTIVSLEDVGVGLSQVIPVIVGAGSDSLKVLYVEQPELHLHPKQQAMLGDVFAMCAKMRFEKDSSEGSNPVSELRTTIVETHSELLILRLLRLVRETNLGVASAKGIKLTPRQLKVYYVGSNEEGTLFKEIQISDTGKFIQPWPDDFFELDFQERFA